MEQISVVILTYNEEQNIRDAISSCKQISNDILILDSYSHDNTCDIALELGARVMKNKFEGYASQRNFAFQNIQYKNSWLLMLDADECMTIELATEIQEKLVATTHTMFRFRRKDYLFNKWLKHSSGYPTWFPRLFKLGECWVEREINEIYRTTGITGELENHILHFPFNKGISDWFHKHNRYSEMEAELIFNESNKLKFQNLFSSDKLDRREAQKALVYGMPCRPLVVFIIFYFLKCGFLDGKSGFYYCTMKFCYELMISCKVYEKVSKNLITENTESDK